jgi:pyruvate dehydrogenase E1 component alpha subunit
MKADDLIKFEEKVVTEYKKGFTYGPVHLSGGNEEQLIKIFKDIKRNDWVFSTHRSHYHALLKSKDKEWLMNEIIKKANSSHINSRKYKIFTSAIVGGIIPIALGVAYSIKLKKQKSKVYCFVGDMASEMGCFNEAVKYAINFDLPIIFVIEDNGLGCNSPTEIVWGNKLYYKSDKVIYYRYVRKYPHYGVGEFIKLQNKLKTEGDYNVFK